MPWHYAIADDIGAEGWQVTLTWREAIGELVVSQRRFWPDGREYDAEWEKYESLTLDEARDVASACVEKLSHPQGRLFPI